MKTCWNRVHEEIQLTLILNVVSIFTISASYDKKQRRASTFVVDVYSVAPIQRGLVRGPNAQRPPVGLQVAYLVPKNQVPTVKTKLSTKPKASTQILAVFCVKLEILHNLIFGDENVLKSWSWRTNTNPNFVCSF